MDETASKCSSPLACIELPGLIFESQPEEIFDVPGGSLRIFYLAFSGSYDCADERLDCERYRTLDQALRSIDLRRPVFDITLRFEDDGKHTVRCHGTPIDRDYLKQIGWTTIRCRQGRTKF